MLMLQKLRSWLATGHEFLEDLPERQQLGLMIALAGFALICMLFYKILATLIFVCGILALVVVAYMFASLGWLESAPEEEEQEAE